MPEARVPLISKRDDVAPEHHAAFDASPSTRGRVAGPFAVLFHSPEVAKRAALLGDHRVGGGLFEGLRKRLGARGMVELTATVGYYAMIASTLNTFEVEPEPGADHLPV